SVRASAPDRARRDRNVRYAVRDAHPIPSWSVTPPAVGAIGTLVLLVLLTSGVPIGAALGLTGLGGLAWLLGVEPALVKSGIILFQTLSRYELGVLPLFLLMAHLCFAADASRDFFNAAARLFGHRPGGLALASIGACAGSGRSAARVWQRRRPSGWWLYRR